MNHIGRLAVATTSAGVLLIAGAGSAFAHECFNAKRSANGNAGAAASQGWNTFAEDAAFFFFPGLCDEGIAILADAAGVTPDTPILGNATMASGTGGAGTPAIHYLDLESLFPAVPDALAACAP
ncbi:MAG TPA: hypothetical protein VF423_03010 [Actinomycetes bacterium]